MSRTSIPCSKETQSKLLSLKEDRGVTWDRLLQDLATESDSKGTNSNELDYDDVKQACSSALRDELPEGAFR